MGRNEKLSIREIEAYLKTRGNEIVRKSHEENGLLIEVDLPIPNNMVNELGGTISIGEVLAYSLGDGIYDELDKIMIYTGEKNKLTYTLWEFSSYGERIKDYLKDRFKSEKLKTAYKGLTGYVDSQSGEKESRPSSKLIEEEYFIFEEEGKQYFGKITQKCDYSEIEKRDMEKPSRRPSLDISPRLAKILINLSGVKVGEKIYDPFCGIGVVLQEALIQGIDAVGSEIDSVAVKGAEENMKWFEFPKERYLLINSDSSKVEIPEVNGIATEPDLGSTLKKIPTRAKAESTLKEFENLMISVINNVKEHVKGKIVFTSPHIRIGKKRLHCNIENICERTGYSLADEGIAEFRENQIVGRMIYVLQND